MSGRPRHRPARRPIAPGQLTVDALLVVLLPNGRSLTLLQGGRRDDPEPVAPISALRRRVAA